MRTRTIQILSISLFVFMLLWGFWTLFYYLGTPPHFGVLVPGTLRDSIPRICAPGAFLCIGFNTFVPFLWHTVTRVPFLTWYAVISLCVYAAYLCLCYVRTLKWSFECQLSPWKLLLLFVGSMWLLFTILSVSGQANGMNIGRIVEPVPEVYKSAGEEAIVTLRANYESLKERGCLTPIGFYGGRAEVSEISIACRQGAFFSRILPPFFILILFAFEFLILGRFLLHRLFRIRPDNEFAEALLSAATGICGWIALLWFGAVFSILTSVFGWGLLMLVPALLYKQTLYWVKQFLNARWSVSLPWYSVLILITWFLMSYLALNYLNVVRPFPIGWDDLGSYLNRPRQLVSYGSFIFSMQTFQWEYLTALGFLLFGFNSTFGATVSLVTNWMEGLLAVLAVFLFGRTFLGRGRGLLAASLYYALPLVGHFSFADMKIDNAVFTMGALATLCTFTFLFPREGDEDPWKKRVMWLCLAGVFLGFGFGMKVTTIMVAMSLGAVLLGSLLGNAAFIGAVVIAFAVFVKQGALDMSRLLERLNYNPEAVSPMVFVWLCIIVGVSIIAITAVFHRDRFRITLLSALVLVGGFAGSIFPWVMHNNYQHGYIIPRLSLGSPNNVSPIIDKFGTRVGETPYTLPPELSIDKHHETCEPSGGEEELGRYWGYRKGWSHYLTLPFRSVMNLDSAGYYVTTQPALLLFPLLLLLPFFWLRKGRWFRWMWLSTLFILLEWSFLAHGIPWYGIGVFLGLVIGLEAFIAKTPDVLNRSLAAFFITISLIICVSMRMWQFETQRNLFEYPLGKVSAEALRERTIPHYDDITDIVLGRYETIPERPLLYRVGTFMPYFIPKNLEVIGVSDHQLDFFNCLHQDRDAQKTVERFKALGFNSIIFDTNTATIERDPNGSLHQKVNAFTEFLNNPESGLQIIINDSGAGIAFLLIP